VFDFLFRRQLAVGPTTRKIPKTAPYAPDQRDYFGVSLGVDNLRSALAAGGKSSAPQLLRRVVDREVYCLGETLDAALALDPDIEQLETMFTSQARTNGANCSNVNRFGLPLTSSYLSRGLDSYIIPRITRV
jgi:hypothetical protein